MLQERIDHRCRFNAALELDDNAHALTVGLVAQIANFFNPSVAYKFRNAFNQRGLVLLIGNFADDDAAASAAHGFGVNLAAYDDAPFAGRIRFLDAVRPQNDAAGRKIGTFDELHQIVGFD